LRLGENRGSGIGQFEAGPRRRCDALAGPARVLGRLHDDREAISPPLGHRRELLEALADLLQNLRRPVEHAARGLGTSAHAVRRLRALLGQLAHFVGHDGEPAPVDPGAGGFDRGVERQEVGLVRDRRDRVGEALDFLRGVPQRRHLGGALSDVRPELGQLLGGVGARVADLDHALRHRVRRRARVVGRRDHGAHPVHESLQLGCGLAHPLGRQLCFGLRSHRPLRDIRRVRPDARGCPCEPLGVGRGLVRRFRDRAHQRAEGERERQLRREQIEEVSVRRPVDPGVVVPYAPDADEVRAVKQRQHDLGADLLAVAEHRAGVGGIREGGRSSADGLRGDAQIGAEAPPGRQPGVCQQLHHLRPGIEAGESHVGPGNEMVRQLADAREAALDAHLGGDGAREAMDLVQLVRAHRRGDHPVGQQEGTEQHGADRDGAAQRQGGGIDATPPQRERDRRRVDH
jgi:hypothetical protein